jgi:cell division protein FtsL
MSNLLYLVVALVLSAIGITVLWFRTRRPRSMTAHIEEFARELDALAPERQRRRAARERPSG